jgi:hypothetical protein
MNEDKQDEINKLDGLGHVLEKLVSKFDESNKLKEEIESLRNEIKSIRETRSKGDMTSQQKPYEFVFVEAKTSKEIASAPKNAFVTSKPNGGMEVFAAHPDELY